ncbi:MAG TPA: murein L,D-transpeptidase catalytic domain family protein [Chitinophagaceae bacterium]
MSGLFVLHSSFEVVPTANTTGTIAPLYDKAIHKNTIIDAKASSLYSSLQLAEKGLSEKAFQHAYKGYQVLLEKELLTNTRYLTICDFTQSSKQKRLYIIDLENNEVLMNTWVAHGRNSGIDKAVKFSNKPSSLQSSLGFYITQQTYYGANGLSLRLNGVERGFNDKAMRRAIVIHGADYIGDEKKGRSFGCPAVPKEENATIINTIKNGTCLFIYYPAKNYLKGSKILNG